MKRFNIFLAMTIALSFFAGTMAAASTILTLSCRVETEAERTDDVSTPTISFDAQEGYKNLIFIVYGSKVSVSATLNISSDGKMCSNRVDQICTQLDGSYFCTGGPEANFFPTDKYAQPGDRTTVKCELKGGEAVPCSPI